MNNEEQQKLAYRNSAQPGTLFYRIGWDGRVSKVKVEKVMHVFLYLEDGTKLSKKTGAIPRDKNFTSHADYEPVLPCVTERLEAEEKHKEVILKFNNTYQDLLSFLEYSREEANTMQKRIDLTSTLLVMIDNLKEKP